MKDTKTIEFTRRQFETLLKLVYLGNWMANANRETDILKEYEDMESYLFSHAGKFGFKKYTSTDRESGKEYYPSANFEENTEVHDLHEEYDEETFWDELIDKLAVRDFHKKYREIQIDKMSEVERWAKIAECEEKWGEEIERFGLRRMGIVKE